MERSSFPFSLSVEEEEEEEERKGGRREKKGWRRVGEKNHTT